MVVLEVVKDTLVQERLVQALQIKVVMVALKLVLLQAVAEAQAVQEMALLVMLVALVALEFLIQLQVHRLIMLVEVAGVLVIIQEMPLVEAVAVVMVEIMQIGLTLEMELLTQVQVVEVQENFKILTAVMAVAV
jgi:hypothetical protein